MSEKRRLGRGLDALVGGAVGEAAGATAAAVAEVPIHCIQTNPYQPRREFDPEALATLKESLVQHGLLQPVVVRPTGDGAYQLIAGERRLRAARDVGWQNIAVHVVDLNDRQVFEAALVENLQRADLNPLEKAQGFHDYATQYQATHDDIAKAVGLDRSTISNLIRLLELPPSVQDAVRTGQIAAAHARALLALDDPAQQEQMCREIIAKGLSVRQVETLVKQAKLPTAADADAASAAPTVEKTAHVQALEDELKQTLAAKVQIRVKGQDKGQIVIHFETNDDFERVLGILKRPAA
jgi:ParB family chromosome partitioning protein